MRFLLLTSLALGVVSIFHVTSLTLSSSDKSCEPYESAQGIRVAMILVKYWYWGHQIRIHLY